MPSSREPGPRTPGIDITARVDVCKVFRHWQVVVVEDMPVAALEDGSSPPDGTPDKGPLLAVLLPGSEPAP